MNKVTFPQQLDALLIDSPLQPGIRARADRAGAILADNKLTFFPDYTDHGVEHINRVLKSQVELVPSEVWKKCAPASDDSLLCAADAAVIIGATLLHDLAMHLTVSGFRELISPGSRFVAVEWFEEDHEEHRADLPWHELWLDYEREARRLSERDLTNIVGEKSARSWKFDGLPATDGAWQKNDYLIVGEFIRRHHARLAHEIALCGFPGAPAGDGTGAFPAMGKSEHLLNDLADLIGLTARSHGTSLRICKAYLDEHLTHGGALRPSGCAALYPMALLRVADYLQLEHTRAPAVLLQLREPQSPISVMEWEKHRAVRTIGRHKDDPRAKMITVSEGVTLRVYLQLRDLLAGLQREMDHSTAVLDEMYGEKTAENLHLLQLATRRVYSNLQTPAFRKKLPYVPSATGFSADPHILTLLVEPLYGKEPGVGVRELMQNSVDAVRELETWCTNHGKTPADLDVPKLAEDADVLIDYIKREDGTWFLQITDRGIGMTPDTIQHYFLRAGASFRRSKEWAKENLDEHGKPKVLRSGRFGIGAFAVFLLGTSFKLQTRHATAPKSEGYSLEASENSTLIQLSRESTDFVGTRIDVELSEQSVRTLRLYEISDFMQSTDWYHGENPRVRQRICWQGHPKRLKRSDPVPASATALLSNWAKLCPPDFDAVFWHVGMSSGITCNGLLIANPGAYHGVERAEYIWEKGVIQLDPPEIAVIDSRGMLALDTRRYGLADPLLPFLDMLARDVTLSFIAHALVCGPGSRDEIHPFMDKHPLAPFQIATIRDGAGNTDQPTLDGRLRLCATGTHFVPVDSCLYRFLDAESYFLNAFVSTSLDLPRKSCTAATTLGFNEIVPQRAALVHWFCEMDFRAFDVSIEAHEKQDWYKEIATAIVTKGVEALRLRNEASRCVGFSSLDGALENKLHYTASKAGGMFHFSSGVDTSPSFHEGLLNKVIESMFQNNNYDIPLLVVGQFRTVREHHTPETLLAKVWVECLGELAIPFDPAERQKLIEHGRNHSELRRHIEMWQQKSKMIAAILSAL